MDTAPPGLLSWQPGTLSPQLNCQKFRKSSSRKHQWARQSKANNVGVTGRRAHLAKWCSQSERSLRDRVSVVPKRGTTDSLASNSSHSLSGCNGSGLSEVVRRKVHPCRHVCNAADNGALYSSADLSANGSYDSKGVSLLYFRRYQMDSQILSVSNTAWSLMQCTLHFICRPRREWVRSACRGTEFSIALVLVLEGDQIIFSKWKLVEGH